jgi:serine/threonine-protein kinase
MNAIAATALGVMLALTTGASAVAQVCSDTCDEYDQGTCVVTRHTCTTPAPPPPAYGAIAYGRTSKAWGYSHHWASQAKAESVAKQNCAQHGSDCEVMVWYKNQCGAVASADGDAAYWGLGDGIGAARGNALSTCAKSGGKNCAIQVAECSR